MTNLTSLLGQTRILTIYFDTLNIQTNSNFHLLTSKKVISKEEGEIYSVIDTLISQSLIAGVQTDVSFCVNIKNYNDSSELLISLDNDGGYLRILDWVKVLNDTIRFDNWKTYTNCNRDSIYTTVAYYKRTISEFESSETGKLLKVKKKINTRKVKCLYPTPLFKTAFRMNYKLYMVSIQTQLTYDIVQHGHGFNKDIYTKKYPKDKKLIFNHTIIETRKYSNFIVVRMKNEA